MKNPIESRLFTKIIVVLAIFAAALAIFWLGTMVGYRQAELSSRWAGHYAEVFGDPRSRFAFGPGPDGLASSNGAVGTVVAVSLPTIALRNAHEPERVIVIQPDTVIRRFRSPATTSDIRVGDFLMTIGPADEQGRIAATFVRIAPPAPTSSPSIRR